MSDRTLWKVDGDDLLQYRKVGRGIEELNRIAGFARMGRPAPHVCGGTVVGPQRTPDCILPMRICSKCAAQVRP
jgi:hypothetical protein